MKIHADVELIRPRDILLLDSHFLFAIQIIATIEGERVRPLLRIPRDTNTSPHWRKNAIYIIDMILGDLRGDPIMKVQ